MTTLAEFFASRINRGIPSRLNYDLAGRMSSRDSDCESTRHRARSPIAMCLPTTGAGRVLTAYTGRYGNTVTNVYDSVGRKASEALLIATQTYTVGINYNARGELIKYTYPMARSSIAPTMPRVISTKSSSLALRSIHEPTMPLEGWPPAPIRTA